MRAEQAAQMRVDKVDAEIKRKMQSAERVLQARKNAVEGVRRKNDVWQQAGNILGSSASPLSRSTTTGSL